jgi:hypothetical protein
VAPTIVTGLSPELRKGNSTCTTSWPGCAVTLTLSRSHVRIPAARADGAAEKDGDGEE